MISTFWNNAELEGKNRNDYRDWETGDEVFLRAYPPQYNATSLADDAAAQTDSRGYVESEDVVKETAFDESPRARIGPPRELQLVPADDY